MPQPSKTRPTQVNRNALETERDKYCSLRSQHHDQVPYDTIALPNCDYELWAGLTDWLKIQSSRPEPSRTVLLSKIPGRLSEYHSVLLLEDQLKSPFSQP